MQKQSDFLLLLTILSHSKGEIVGRKRFQKIICILKHKYHIPLSYEFIPYHYGPYAESLANTLDLLVSVGLVIEEKGTINDDVFQYIYKLTPNGNKFASSAEKNLGQNLMRKISSAIDEIHTMNTRDLVKLSKEVFGLEFTSYSVI